VPVALEYIDQREIERLRAVADPIARAALVAQACRVNTLYMIKRAGSGHVGTSFSAMDLLVWLHGELVAPGDRIFSSKGHDAPGTYAVMAAFGELPFERIHGLRRLGGLPGHPDVATMPEMVTSTGSLGMGVSKARGFVLADRLRGDSGRVFVLTGDGELQEGQFWESLQPTANRRLHEICVIVDHNKLQSDTWVSEVSDLGDLSAKIASFGWAVARADGHDIRAFSEALDTLRDTAHGRPQMLIADTVKGCGVSFMEPHTLPVAGDSLYAYHSGAPGDDEYERAIAELVGDLDRRLDSLGLDAVTLTAGPPSDPPAVPAAASSKAQRLIGAYGAALAAAASRRRDLIVLDGDLSLDTGLTAVRAAHPHRFVECGIAEQDMVSSAGAMALAGLLPAVHSFACFLTPRANEQIYNNACEATKVIYLGALAGIVPGGPGHSHQSVRDIGAMAGMPGMTLVEPYCDHEIAQLVDWAVDEADGPVYIRLVSVPWGLGFEPPKAAPLQLGQGTSLRQGSDWLIVATGPVLVSQAWAAAELLETAGLSVGVTALPWLRNVDPEWLVEVAGGASILTLDNHYLAGGQGEAIVTAMAAVPGAPSVHRLGVDRVPVCGRNDEVLAAHGLDAAAITEAVRARSSAGVSA
jgi:transketolase